MNKYITGRYVAMAMMAGCLIFCLAHMFVNKELWGIVYRMQHFSSPSAYLFILAMYGAVATPLFFQRQAAGWSRLEFGAAFVPVLVGITFLSCFSQLSLFYYGRDIILAGKDAIIVKKLVSVADTGSLVGFMSVTPLALLMGSYGFNFGDKRLRSIGLLCILAIIPFILVRGVFFERLPVLEALVCIGFPALLRTGARKAAIYTVVCGVVLLGLFAIGEYFRAWEQYRASAALGGGLSGGFGQFIFIRLFGYYTTPINITSYFVNFPFSTDGYYVGRFFWNTPVVGGIMEKVFPAFEVYLHRESWLFALDPQAGLNPEYNLLGFYGFLLWDFGWWALIVAALIGFGIAFLVRSYANGNQVGLLLFPVILIGCLESYRLLYWTNERNFCTVGGILLAASLRLPLLKSARIILPVNSNKGKK